MQNRTIGAYYLYRSFATHAKLTYVMSYIEYLIPSDNIKELV